jgi:hypothetical protein
MRTSPFPLALLAVGALWPSSAPASPPAVRELQLRGLYKDRLDAAGRCDRGSERGALGHAPSAPGRYPLFVYLTGTTMRVDGPEAMALTRAMAERGFVALSVGYENGAYAYCTGMQQKARCLFGPPESASALSALCARPDVDCDRGIVVSGFSQGANLGSLAKDLEPRVRGAYLLGHGHRAANFMDVSACMEHDKTALAPSELRSVNGEHDGYFGEVPARVQAQLERVTGAHCSEATCLDAQGAGYVMVRDGELADRTADHCYFFHSADGRCAKLEGLDPVWEKGSAPWSMGPSLDWLAARVTPARGSAPRTR